MGQGTSTNFWSTGNDGVRVTVVDAETGTAVSSSVDFANRSQPATVLHFGKDLHYNPVYRMIAFSPLILCQP